MLVNQKVYQNKEVQVSLVPRKKRKWKGKAMLVNQKEKGKRNVGQFGVSRKEKGNVGHVTASKQRNTGHVGLSNESSITSHRFSFSCKAIKDSLKLLFTSSVNEENTKNLTFWLIKAYINTTMTKTINYFSYPNQSSKKNEYDAKWLRDERKILNVFER